MSNDDLFICIDHVGYAVHNLDEAIKFHTEVLGWRVLHRETNEEQGVEEAMIGTGDQLPQNAQVQLLAPLNENSTIAKWIERNGGKGGIQQVAYRVADLDMAYQGFGHGLTEDGAVVGKFVAAGLNIFVSTSFSKSFSLYGERVGALSVVCASKEETAKVLSQLKIMIRTNYSNPPIHGGSVVAMVLQDPALRAQWDEELAGMRSRIKLMRTKLVEGLKAAGVKQDMSFITTQIGMFSYSGLSKDQMLRLRSEFGVYGTDTGRMCVAALNSKNIDYVCASIAKVI